MRRFAMIATLFAASAAAFAQYPSKPIRLMIGYTAGGSAEAGARPLARALEPLLGQPLVFEYRPGNAGGVAMEAVAKVPADGYTLYYFDSGPLTVAPHVGKIGYDPFKSFTQLGHVCGSGSLLVVHPSTPFHSVAEVIEASKREPNKWSYGTSGVGGPHHLSGEYFKSVTGANLLHVPYKGGGPAMTDLMGGQIPMLFSSLGPAVGAVKSGRIRPLATPTAPASPKMVNELTVNAATKRPTSPNWLVRDCPSTKDNVPRNDTPQGLNSWAKPATAAGPRKNGYIIRMGEGTYRTM